MRVVEVGTSDFETLAGTVPGLFIEPVKYYFDRLPECNKLNAAISNYNGTLEVYYVTEETINELNLSYWARGCSSVLKPHPTIKRHLQEVVGDNWLDYVSSDTVPVYRLVDILLKYNITELDYLKIDTEGHDTVILQDFFMKPPLVPNVLTFEWNRLTDKEEANNLKLQLEDTYNYNFHRKDDNLIGILPGKEDIWEELVL